MKLSVVDKYLRDYAEQELTELAYLSITKQYHYVLVIPAYKETTKFIERFCQSALSQQNVLIIFVINQPDIDDDKKPQHLLYQQACCFGQQYAKTKSLTLIDLEASNSSLLLVNRYECPIPVKQGVGLARKIGCDLALSLIHQNIVTSQFIASSDADAVLPDDYFQQQSQLLVVSNAEQITAAYYNFSHACENIDIHLANQQYEKALRYYVAGLIYAGSAYAFFTIGSILVFSSKAYANVRGFPKKSAGEDFYLLNKLAKLGQVKYIKSSVIQLEARLSDRVPFGTGPAVSRIIELNKTQQAYCYYHPNVFIALKHVLAKVDTMFDALNHIDVWLHQLSIIEQQALISIGFNQFIAKHQHNTKKQFYKQWQTWFDAFKTLKFIHAVREQEQPDIPLTEALKLAPFTI